MPSEYVKNVCEKLYLNGHHQKKNGNLKEYKNMAIKVREHIMFCVCLKIEEIMFFC